LSEDTVSAAPYARPQRPAIGRAAVPDSISGVNGAYVSAVMPAKAGIQRLLLNLLKSLDSRFRGNDESRGFRLKEAPLISGLPYRARKSPQVRRGGVL